MNAVLVDDHLLLQVLLGDASADLPADASLATTGLWYHRLCRALANDAVVGALSRQLGGVDEAVARSVVNAVIDLPDNIDVISLRALGWPMAKLAADGRRLNLLSLEALAAAQSLSAELWLSPASRDSPLHTEAPNADVPVRIIGQG